MTEQGDLEQQGKDRAVDEAVMHLLHDHVPLTLLVDLADAPASEEVLVEEGLPDQEWWEHLPHQGGPTD